MKLLQNMSWQLGLSKYLILQIWSIYPHRLYSAFRARRSIALPSHVVRPPAHRTPNSFEASAFNLPSYLSLESSNTMDPCALRLIIALIESKNKTYISATPVLLVQVREWKAKHVFF